MKKVLFFALLGSAAMMSAKGNLVDNKLELNSNKMLECVDAKLIAPPQYHVVYTSCGVAASTVQDFTFSEYLDWAERVETANCGGSLNTRINLNDDIDFNDL